MTIQAIPGLAFLLLGIVVMNWPRPRGHEGNIYFGFSLVSVGIVLLAMLV